ncbi:DUF6427 family protein [Zhouia sp. PK063]|uniref:DUF6427 family protein n=1 Tax=Zhouia sp. PK063 TaxID=3373602 RepID=UPI00378CDCB9
MISSIFGKTKPINFVLIGILFVLFFVSAHFFIPSTAYKTPDLPKSLGILLTLTLSVFLINFIDIKNKLSAQNSYVFLFFVLFLGMFPQTFISTKISIASLFILFSVRRLASLRSNINVKQKLFDASIFIAIASIFYNWSLVFYLLVYLSIIIFTSKDYRNWLVPFIGFFTVAFLMFTYEFLTDDFQFNLSYLTFEITLNTEKFRDINYLLPMSFLVVLGIVAALFYLNKLQSKTGATRAIMLFIFLYLLITVAIGLITDSHNGAELIFIGFPLMVIIANYIENLKIKWLKESVLWVLLLLPILIHVLELTTVR